MKRSACLGGLWLWLALTGCSATGGYDGVAPRPDASVTEADSAEPVESGADSPAEAGDAGAPEATPADGSDSTPDDVGDAIDTGAPDTVVPADSSVPDSSVADSTVATDTADSALPDSGADTVVDTKVDSCICTTPPPADCADGSTARTWGAVGTCDSAGACVYPPTLKPCTAPPTATCVAGALRTYTSPGTCSSATCTYPSTDKACPGGCTGAVCKECLTTADCTSGKVCSAGTCVSDACSVALTYDFEASDQGFTHAPLSTFATDDPWKRGTPTGTTTCHGGTKCFSTGLTAAYGDCQTAEFVFPTMNLSACAASPKKVTLSFWHYYDFEAFSSSKYWDGGLLQVSTDGTTWTDVTTSQAYDGTITGDYTGCSPTPLVSGHKGWSATIPGGAWKQVTYDIGTTVRVATLRFRLLYGSDAATTKRGWFIDDVAVTSSP